MRTTYKLFAVCAAIILAGPASTLRAEPLLTTGDFSIAIDLDSPGSLSSYPAAENPPKIIDRITTTKYLNFGKANSGFIITPAAGPTIVQSFVLTTANDAVERDPTSFALYGTNDAIISLDNSLGTAENWTLIATGALSLPDTRNTLGPVVTITNATSYTSYKLLFPTLKSEIAADSMQVAECQFYPTADGTGTGIFATTDPIRAVDADIQYGGHAAAEGAPNAFDHTNAIYRNTGGVNSGFIVTPWVGPTVVTSFQITTGLANPEQDPISWALYGTNDPIIDADNGNGSLENWALISSGAIDLPTNRSALGPAISITNSLAYLSYRMIFTGLRNIPTTATACQIGEIQFDGTILATLPHALLVPTDPIIAIDLDGVGTTSSYPAAEIPANVLDGVTTTKYLNFGKDDSGFIVTPAGGASIVRSMLLTTANDSEERDPASFALFGTNDPIVSADNSLGNGESWTPIAAGPLSLPSARQTPGPLVTFPNAIAYTSYRLIFTTVKNATLANSMQIADVAFYPSTDGSGLNILVPGSPILAIDLDPNGTSSSPFGEEVAHAIDGLLAKYLNAGNVNSGFIVTPAAGATNVTAFRIVTGNDFPARDPAAWVLAGTNDPIRSTNNSVGRKENWIPIASGTVALPIARNCSGPLVTFANSEVYTSYRMVFTDLRIVANAGSMQFGEIQFYGQVGLPCPVPFADFDADHDVDIADYGVFQACFTGSAPGQLTANCRCFDTGVKDGLIDSQDLVRFMNCFTGPSVTWSQQLTPDCVP